jgi:thiol-disulfide isomerase/thioredoxin
MSGTHEGGDGAAERSPARLTLVYAHWCPHCDPISLVNAPRLAEILGVPLRLLDIDDPAQERLADELVRDHGDWAADYLIPQLFLEGRDGSVTHLMTGVPGDPDDGTRREWSRLIARGAGILRGRDSPRQ